MVWLLGTLGGMAKGAVNASKKSLEFVVDIGQEVVGLDDEYDGVWGTIWGSWEDNILGAEDGDGVVQHLFGEEGVGGRFFGAIPEEIRSPATSIINPVFDAMEVAYKYGVDRNIGTLIGVGQRGLMNSFDALTGQGDIGDVFSVFDPNEWRQAYKITESRSAGQALAMASRWIDLDDPAEVERFKGTAYYNMVSGTFDAFSNIILDPANVLLGTGKVGKLSKNAQKYAKKKVGIGYSTTEEAIKKSGAYAKFDTALEKLRFADDLVWSDEYQKGKGFAETDYDTIDILTTRILDEAKKGNLGVDAKKFTPEQARALASLPNKAAREKYLTLAVSGGDNAVLDEMHQAAENWALSHQQDGLHYQLDEINRQLDAGETFVENFDTRKFLETEQKRLEKKLQDENPELPFGAALSIKEERLKTLAARKDVDRGPVTADELNARYDALNDNQALVDAATDQVLIQNHVSTMDALPKIGAFNGAGLAAKTFVERLPVLGGVSSTRLVRAIVEKVPQGMIIWDDTNQSFTAFQRMLRDASRIGIDGIDQGFVDKKLGSWTATNNTEELSKIFNSTVDEINQGIVNKFSQRMEGVNKDELVQILQRQWKAGDSELKNKARNARIYGNKGIRITTAAEGGETVARFMPITTQQLESATLVPRYDLYKQAFTDKSLFKTYAGQGMSVTSAALNGFTSVWKKSVLLRPAWPMRVLIDEYARTSAHLGTIDTLKSVMGGMTDLRANWFRKNGIDLGPDIQKGMLDELGYTKKDEIRQAKIYGYKKGLTELDQYANGKINEKDLSSYSRKRIDDNKGDATEAFNQLKSERDLLIEQNQPVNYYDLIEEFVAKNGEDAATELVRKTIYDNYGRKRIGTRSAVVGVGAGVVAGPVGLAIGALYGLMARNSLQRLAQIETGSAVGLQLRSVARSQLTAEIKSIRASVADVTDDVQLAAANQKIKDLNVAAGLLESQAKLLSEQQRVQRNAMRSENVEMYSNFDKAGKMLTDAGIGGAHIGGVSFANHFGNTPQQIAIYRNAMSADNSNRALWDSASQASQRTQKQLREPRQFDGAGGPKQREGFVQAYNDTVNRQFVPSTDPTVANAYQDFQRLMWEGKTNDELVAWLRSGDGVVLQDAMPHYFAQTDELDYNDVLNVMREEFNSLVPSHPDFADVRKQIIEGREVNWDRDIQPIVNRKYEGDIDNVREALNEPDFGKVIGDSKFEDAAKQGRLLERIGQQLDRTFQNIGTMPTDVLTRSLVFRTNYTKEMSVRIARFEDKGRFKLKESDIKKMELQARDVALKKTRDLLYDLAERSKFEEVVANIMPFYGAWQEVITRWSGLAARNPAFVAAGARNFRQAIEIMDSKDENGDPVFVLRLPESWMGAELGGIKVFGKLAALGDNTIDFNFSSASMISAGLPGFGPLVGIPASETILKVPELAEAFELLLPYGPTEGQTFLERVVKQAQPTWTKTATSALFNTAQRQRVVARITADLMAEYYETGITVETEAEKAAFDKEIQERATQILTVRMLGNLSLPLSFVAQSPHQEIINGYKRVLKDSGTEEASEWLFSKHPEMYGILGRQTRVRSVASATLEGEKLYQETKDFADENAVIGDFIVGKIGALESGFEYNRAVQIKELNEGRRVRLDPSEIYTRSSEAKGWHEYNDQMQIINNELTRRGMNGLSVNLNAKTNTDLSEIKNKIIDEIAITNPAWKEKFNTIKSAAEISEVIHSFRAVVDSDLFEDRVEFPPLVEYIETRDLISEELERRFTETNNPDHATLSHKTNADLKQLWLEFRLEISAKPDFASIFSRYFDKDDSISRVSWPSSYLAKQGVS